MQDFPYSEEIFRIRIVSADFLVKLSVYGKFPHQKIRRKSFFFLRELLSMTNPEKAVKKQIAW